MKIEINDDDATWVVYCWLNDNINSDIKGLRGKDLRWWNKFQKLSQQMLDMNFEHYER